MPKSSDKQAVLASAPGVFITELSALNRLYQVAKDFLERPSLATQTALTVAVEEAEKAYFSQVKRLTGAPGSSPARARLSGSKSRR